MVKSVDQVLAELEERIEYINGEMMQADYSEETELAIGWDKGYLNALCDIRNWMTARTEGDGS